MSSAEAPPAPRSFFPTQVSGLDEVLGGGLRPGALYLVSGATGSGKTILAAQIGFGVARAGGKVLVLTLIAESHGKLLDHLAGFSFFDRAFVGGAILLLNAYETLNDQGPNGLLELLAGLVAEHKPQLLVLEGFGTLRGLQVREFDVAQFVHRLNALIAALGCTALVVDPASRGATGPEQALVDGILELGTFERDGRVIRELQVHKHRAADPLLGHSTFRITGDGMLVFPRLEEAVARRARPAARTGERAPFGIPHLDAMMRGGLMRGATTLLLGAPGSGKTLLGLKYLDQGLRTGEPALYFGFYESPERLLGKAEGIGLALGAAVQRGALRIVWQPAVEYTLDELGYKLLAAVAEHRPRRVVIDGIDAFHQSSVRKERLALFMTALTVELRALGVDLVFTQEAPPMGPHGALVQGYVLSALVENIIVLRYVELRAQLHRLISIMKMRESDYDTSLREFHITSSGLEVAETFATAEALFAAQGASRAS